MVRAQQRIKPVVRKALNVQTNSTYARLEDIDQEISPIYTDEGFSLSFGTADSSLAGHIRVICDCMHAEGHTKQYQMDLPLDATGIGGKTNKTGVHAHGSTNSYARRYLTMMIFNVVMVKEDNDGNGAANNKPEQPVITAPQAAQLAALLSKCSEKSQADFAEKFGSPASVYKSEFNDVLAKLTKNAARNQPQE
ncbi:MAG: ERF family protein [Pseudomonadaceae bacterium]|nr:ERF family protein [Pseudomonadaceae bacterium]